jgi:hypothetical protein
VKNTPIQSEERAQAQHDHHHARDTARSRAEHLLRTMAEGKSRCFRASIHGPMPKATLRRRGIARRFERMLANIQGITHLAAANFKVREKEKESRLV